MRIVIDVRERALIEKVNSITTETPFATKFDISQEALTLGDISIRYGEESKEILIIERKSFADLLASIKDGRYDEQSHRLIHSSGLPAHNIYYIVEGIISQVSVAEKRLIFATMTSLSYFKGFSVVKTGSVQETAEMVLAIADKLAREFAKGTSVGVVVEPSNTNSSETHVASYSNFVKRVKKDNITPENMGEIMLSQIPGISAVTASTIMSKYAQSFPLFISEIQKNPECLKDMAIITNGKSRKISKSAIESIKTYFVGKP